MKYLGKITDEKDLITREFNDHYGECTTGASTQAKVVTIPSLTELYEGLHIYVKFTNNQTYNGVPTLNVNGLGAKNIRRVGGTNAARYEWVANQILHLIYDGTYWVIVDGGFATTTYYGKTKLYTGAASTSTAYALTPSSLNQFAQNVVSGYPVYSTSAAYAVGDRVRYSVRVYECIVPIPDGEAWTAEHWKEVDDLQTQLDNKIKPNPTLVGTEAALTGVEIDGVKYKIEGGSSLTLDSIYISTPPTKTAYIYGDTFDATGMAVKAKYAIDGIVIAEKEVTGYTYSSALTTGQTSVTITYAENGVTKTASQPITVAKATPTVTAPTARSLTYTGSAQNLVNAGSTTGGTLQYSLDGTSYSTTIPTGINATSYTVYYRVAGNANYNDVAAKTVGVTIGKATGTLSVSPTTLTINEGDSGTATITKSFDGTITAGTSDSEVATVSISGNTVTVNGIAEGSATITISASGGTNYTVPANVVISVSVEAASVGGIYGAEWDGTSTTAWTRTDDAANLTDPVPAINNGTGSSPFDNIMPWSGMQIVEDATAGTLVSIPKFWFKWTKDGNKLKLQISPSQQAGFSVSPAHMDRGDGKGERDVVYIGRYHCATGQGYKSLTGYLPQTNLARSGARTNIHNLGSDYWQMDYATHLTIQMLYLVEFADWESQGKIGFGCSPSGSRFTMGLTDAMQYHTGTSATSRETYGCCQYRHVEGLWDNAYDWMDGCYYNYSGMNIILNPLSFSDTSGGTLIGKPSSGYPTAMGISATNGYEWCLYPTVASGGSNTTYVPDYWDYYASVPCLFAGGYYGQDRKCGLFYVFSYSVAGSRDDVGSRLMKLP